MNAANTHIGDWLGLHPLATEDDILRIIEGRLAPSIIKRLAALGLERSEIDAVVIPSRTLQHRRSRREKLSALAWLRKSHPRLDGRTPVSLLKTDTGARIVEELLIQIDEGMFV